jgi:hypothetical protein
MTVETKGFNGNATSTPPDRDKESAHISWQLQLSIEVPKSKRLRLVVDTLVISCHCMRWSQTSSAAR